MDTSNGYVLRQLTELRRFFTIRRLQGGKILRISVVKPFSSSTVTRNIIGSFSEERSSTITSLSNVLANQKTNTRVINKQCFYLDLGGPNISTLGARQKVPVTDFKLRLYWLITNYHYFLYFFYCSPNILEPFHVPWSHGLKISVVIGNYYLVIIICDKFSR